MYSTSSVVPVLGDPTYGLPLVVGVAATILVAWWAFSRRSTPPSMTPYPSQRPWTRRADTAAYLGLEQGHYMAGVELLGRRVGQVLFDRFRLRLEDRRSLREDPRLPGIPGGGSVTELVDELFRAYRSAQSAELPTMGNSWGWVRRYRHNVAARAFEHVTTHVGEALPVLEAS